MNHSAVGFDVTLRQMGLSQGEVGLPLSGLPGFFVYFSSDILFSFPVEFLWFPKLYCIVYPDKQFCLLI